jgi:(p)ppGpp synthase/HD superfamily hydrolase
MMTGTIFDAITLATIAHGETEKRRKYTNEPDIAHPVAVMALVAAHYPDKTDTDLMIAVLHDTVDDTSTTISVIQKLFGDEVADGVLALSDDKSVVSSRAYRKEKARIRLSQASSRIQTIKCADVLHNNRSLVGKDPEFEKIYFPEQMALLDVLTDAHPTLRALAYDSIPAEYWGKTEVPS